LKKLLVIYVIVLFLGVAIAPTINANLSNLTNKGESEEIKNSKTETYKFARIKTPKMSRGSVNFFPFFFRIL
jgi:hypothetical protein